MFATADLFWVLRASYSIVSKHRYHGIAAELWSLWFRLKLLGAQLIAFVHEGRRGPPRILELVRPLLEVPAARTPLISRRSGKCRSCCQSQHHSRYPQQQKHASHRRYLLLSRVG